MSWNALVVQARSSELANFAAPLHFAKDAMPRIAPYIIGVLFVAAGTLHFKNPRMYEAIVPPFLPAHKELVSISGFFEVLGGLGVMLPRTRAAAAWGLIALLLAVFPANAYMALDTAKFARLAPAWALYGRLPLQFVLIWWIWTACIKDP